MDLRDKTFVVTGASSGIGFAAAERLKRDGASVIIVANHPERAERALRKLQALPVGSVALERANLAVLAEVRDLASRIRGHTDRLHGLINNAGAVSATKSLTDDGFERMMAVNHLAPFLLSNLLADALADAGGRIVNVSSEGNTSGDLRRSTLAEIFRGNAWGGMVKAYADSKLANVLFTFEWMRRMGDAGIIANVLSPGLIRTRIWNQTSHPLNLFMRPFKLFLGSPRSAAVPIVRLASAGVADEGGVYFDKRRRPARANPQAYDEGLAAELWQESRVATGLA